MYGLMLLVILLVASANAMLDTIGRRLIAARMSPRLGSLTVLIVLVAVWQALYAVAGGSGLSSPAQALLRLVSAAADGGDVLGQCGRDGDARLRRR